MNARFQIPIAAASLLFNCAWGAEFPGAGGDLSNGGDWGGMVPAGEDVSFANSGRYTSSEGVSFGAMAVLAPEAVFDLSSSGGAVACTSFSLEAAGLDVTVSGGRLVSSGAFYGGSTNATVDAKNNTLVLENGANVSAQEVYVSNKKTGNTLITF